MCFLTKSYALFHILLQVEVKAIPVSPKKTSLQQEQVKKVQRIPGSPATAVSPSSDMTFGGLPSPKLDSSYEPMIVKEARYIAITMMKVSYCNFSNITREFSIQQRRKKYIYFWSQSENIFNANYFDYILVRQYIKRANYT